MSVGYAVTKPILDQRAGALCETLRNTFQDLVTLNDWLLGKTTADLIALGYVNNAAPNNEVDVLKSAIQQLVNLYAIGNGQSTQATTNDFFFFADKLTGIV